MNRKGIKKIMLFLLAFMLVFPVYSFGKAEAVQASGSSIKSTEAFQGGTCKQKC